MKKNYIQPATEAISLEMVNTLCASGTTNKVGFGNDKATGVAL